ncbi:MAG: hypothetical protein WCV62_05390 [Candidatus Peribacteraceae bacterium]|jgi:hypothetical protein
MKNLSRFLIVLVVCAMVSGFGPTTIGLAEAPEAPNPDELETRLTELKRQWEDNQQEYFKQQKDLHLTAEQVRQHLCALGKKDYCPVEGVNVDIRRLAFAVALAETENCKTGTGKSKNNCHGIMQCKGGRCGPRTFDSPEDSYREFERIWIKNYGDRFPTREDAKRYVDSEAIDWYKTVTAIYYGKREVVVPGMAVAE